MTFGIRRSLGAIAAALMAATVVFVSCSDDTSGPQEPLPGRFAAAPYFASAAAGIVDIGSVRFLVIRDADEEVVKDTVVSIGPASDSVDVALTVPVLQPGETFSLFLFLITPAGDTAFEGGPITVTPSTSGATPVVDVELVYVGVGADAASVQIVSAPTTPLLAGASALLEAIALDSLGEPIPGTPIEWTSLDPNLVTFASPDTGVVTAGSTRGSATVVARLLTGPADSANVAVTLPPANLVVVSGSGQTAQIATLLPTPLVARVTASDGIGIPGIQVVFTVATGGGSVAPDTVLTDTSGEASVLWTLGPNVGPQTVEARSPALPGAVATFNATGTSTGVGTVMVFAGDNQAGVVSTALPVAPAVIVQDAQGNPVAGASVTFGVTQGGGSVTGATQTTNAAGIATVGSWTLGASVGTNQLTATVDTLNPVVFTALATGPNGAFTFGITAGNNQSATVGTVLPIPQQVTVLDTAGLPAVGVTVTFVVTGGGGSVTGATPITDTAGAATIVGWTLGPAAGTNTLSASVTGLPSVSFTATGLVGPPSAVIVISGNAQTDTAGSVLPLPLVVEVQDSAGNPVSNVSVTWNTLQGSLTPTSTLTDAQGRTQSTWTLGTNAVSQTATAAVSGVTPTVFSATAIFPNPTILLSLASGSDRIVVGGTDTLNITLTQPVPLVNGLPVTVSSNLPGVISVQTPGSVTIPQNGTTGQIALNAIAGGTATILATAAGYDSGTVNVTGSVQVLSMPSTLNVPFGGTASLPVQISAPAPVGGIDVTLISDNPLSVEIVTPTVNIPQGQQAASATVSGVLPGSANVTGTTTNFGSAVSAVATTANLNITVASTFINESFGSTVTVELQSGGSRIAAPAPGVAVTLTSRSPTCAVATTPVTIPTGLVDTVSAISYGGSALTRCTTVIVATATNIDADSLTVTVDPAPTISYAVETVGAGLQSFARATLGATNHGGVNAVVKSLDPTLAVVAPTVSTPGGDSVVVFVANGQNRINHYVQGLEGVADTGDATVLFEVRAPGFVTDTVAHIIRQPALQLSGVNTNVTTFSPDDAFTVLIGVTNAAFTFFQEFQPIRAGGVAVAATVASSVPAVAQLVDLATAGDTLTVQVAVGANSSPGSVAAGGLAVDPQNAGTTAISATIPGFFTMPAASATVTVSAPTISYGIETVGAGLQSFARATLGATNHGGVSAVVTSLDPTIAVVAPNVSTPGDDSVVVFVPNGQNRVDHYVQGLEGVTDTTVLFEVRAPGFVTDTVAHIVRQPAMQVSGVNTIVTTFSLDDAFTVLIGVTNAGFTFFQEFQAIRAGGVAVTATVTSSVPAVAQLVDSATGGGTLTAQVAVGANQTPTSVAAGGLAVDPQTAGTTVISATITGFFAMPQASATVTVSAPTISYGIETVGAGLQSFARATLGATNHGGVNAVVKSLDPSIALVAPNVSTPGDDSVVVFVPNGQNRIDHYVQGLEGVADTGDATVLFEVRAPPGFVPDTVAHVVRQPALQLSGLNLTTTTFTNDDPFTVLIGVTNAAFTFFQEFQAIRAGGVAANATVTTIPPGVGQLVTDTLTSEVASVRIPVGSNQSPGSVATGGVAFDPLTAGTTTVSASIPGYFAMAAASQVVTVTAPTITLTNRTVGAGLQRNSTAFLGAPAPPLTNLIIKSSAPGIALVSPDISTPGMDSISIPLGTGATSRSYYIQGVEGQTGAVTFTASAAGYTDGTAVKTIRQPALQLSGLAAATTTLTNDDPFTVLIGVTNATFTFFEQFQAIRAGGAAVTATVTSSDSGVARLVNLTTAGDTLTAQIAVGANQTPGNVATGGLAVDPQTAGTTAISATIPGFFAMPLASVTVTVSAPTITLTNRTVGAGLQRNSTAFLQAPAPAGTDLIIKSSAPGIALVSPDVSTPGTDSIIIPLNTGATSRTYYIQGVEGQTGAVTFTARAVGYTDGTAIKTIVQPALQINSLSTTATAGAADDPFTILVGAPNAGNTSMQDFQEVRAGGTALTAAVTSSNVAVGQLVTTALTGDSVTVTIDLLMQSSPTNVAAGGVAHDPLTAGTVIISASIPGFILLPAAAVTITVNP